MKIAVVGTGMSAASFYHHLNKEQHEVVFFEKARGCGGRLAWRRVEGIGEFDHGAQFFTVRDVGFREVVAKAGDSIGKIKGSVNYYKNGSKLEATEADRFYAKPANGLVKSLLTGADIRLKSRVDKIICNERDVSLQISEQEQIEGFDLVVVTAPGPQARELIPDSEDKPDLDYEMEPCFCTMLALQKGAYNLDEDAAFVSGTKLSWFALNSRKERAAETDCVTLHGSAEFSQTYTVERKELLEKELVQEFLDLSNIHEDQISHKVSHFWRYSKPKNVLSQNSGFYLSKSGKIGLIGDYFMGGRVEGAFISGKRLAEALN